MIDAINSQKNPAMDEKAAETTQQQARTNTPNQNVQQDAAHLQRLINEEHRPTSRRTAHESSTMRDEPTSTHDTQETQSQSKPRDKEEVNKREQKNPDEHQVNNQKKEHSKKTSQKSLHDDTSGQQTVDPHKDHHKKISREGHHDTNEQQPLMTSAERPTSMPHAQPTAPQATATAQASTISPALTQVAERILVSSQQAHGGEVRIKVDSRLLPQTEIRLTERGGGLMVQMNTASPVSHHVLATEQSNLADLLTRQSGLDVDVQLNYTSEQEQGNPDQRSRGLDLMDDETPS